MTYLDITYLDITVLIYILQFTYDLFRYYIFNITYLDRPMAYLDITYRIYI